MADNINKNSWTDPRIEQLKTLWASGMSCSLIAKAMGGITRNAVIGKVQRLGLQGRGSASKPSAVKVARRLSPDELARRAKVVVEAAAAARAAQAALTPKLRRGPNAGLAVFNAVRKVEIMGRDQARAADAPKLRVVQTDAVHLQLADLGAHQCRWPMDDPGPGNMDRTMFCAAGPVDDGEVYCMAHRTLSSSPSAKLARNGGQELIRSLRRFA